MNDAEPTPAEVLDRLRRTDPTHAAHAAETAARRAEEAEHSARELAAQATAAAETLRLVQERGAAFQASLEQAKLAFLAEADRLVDRKVPTIPALIELAQSIQQTQKKLFVAVESPLELSSGERSQASVFAQRVVNSHPSARILFWLSPLLTR